MSDIAIRVETIGKAYRLGQHHRKEAYRSLRDTIGRAATAPLRYIRSRGKAYESRSKTESIWALRDISFDVHEGEIVGIIGRNGAGKSTLLKILSQITEPTEGQAAIYGRIGSLLEVGTGFHSELTGRENIYLNGAILGMKKSEIDRQFDAIVSFSEVEKFIDTPLKRYSSGMGMRLAFSVAAHLNPEILLMDEVLAVGDVAFQQKCLNKMDDVAKAGRTVVFVSHNMSAIRNLCPRTIVLEQGQKIQDCSTDEAIRTYMQVVSETLAFPSSDKPVLHTEWAQVDAVYTINEHGEPVDQFFWSDPVTIQVDWQVLRQTTQLRMNLMLYNEDGVTVLTTKRIFDHLAPGAYRIRVNIPEKLLNAHAYMVKIVMTLPRIKKLGELDPAARFTMLHERIEGEIYTERQIGVIKVDLPWELESCDPQDGPEQI